MLTKEQTIGNYLSDQKALTNLQMNFIDRGSMVALLQELHRIKKYHIETLFLACSIADRFLAKLAEEKRYAPSLISLATVCLLMAAKLYEHITPSFDIMIGILPSSLKGSISRSKLIKLEKTVIQTLDFNLQYDGPITFLERYQRVLCIDEEHKYE